MYWTCPFLVLKRYVTYCVHMQYTFILTASKQLPKQCTDYQSGKSKQRKSVGVRIPDDAVLQVLALVCQIYLLVSAAYIR